MAREPISRTLLTSLTALRRPGDLRDALVADLGLVLSPTAWHLRAQRADDFLALDFFLYNLRRAPGPKAQAVRIDPARPAYLVVQFQGQSFGEQVYAWSGNPNTSEVPSAPPATLTQARLSGPSRLAFRMPGMQAALPLTLTDFLGACRDWPMSLDALAVPLPATFTDDLPTRGGLVAPFDSIGMAAALSRAVLASAGFDRLRGDLTEALGAESPQAITRAAALAGRRVVARVLEDLGRGQLDEETLATLADDQVKAAVSQSGLRAADRTAVRALVDIQVAEALARTDHTAGDFSIGAISRIPGILHYFLNPHKPAATVTALELPYRIYQTPLDPAGWQHADAPIRRGARTELWHTRLTPRVAGALDETTPARPMLRAIWSPDYKKPDTPGPMKTDPFKMSLTPLRRSNIVRLTAGFDETSYKPDTTIEEPYIPKPVTAHRAMLTALGAWLNAEGFWTRRPVDHTIGADPTILPLEAWRHLSAMGRDYYVRVVEAGSYYALGHAASVVTISERMFADIPGSSDRAAYLRQYRFIVTRETSRTFPREGQKFDGRDFPFRKVEILTKVTPILLPPGSTPQQSVAGMDGEKVFWPMYDPGDGTKQDVRLKIRATDMSGREVSFSMPLIFVRDDANDTATIGQIHTAYGADPRARVPLDGQLVELAPQVVNGDSDGDTVMPVKAITFGGATPTFLLPPNRPRYFPTAAKMELSVPALDGLAKFGKPLQVAYADIYKTSGFATPQNTGQVFLKTVGGDTALAFGGAGAGSDGVGGLVAPNMSISALSRSHGPVGGNDAAFSGGQFDPADFFPSAKLFGTIDLKDIVAPVAVTLLGAAVPKLKKVEFPDRIEISFEFKREAISSPLPILVTGAGGDTDLTVIAKAISHFTVDDPENPMGNFNNGGMDPGLKNPEVTVDASLTNFKLNLFGCVIIWFDKLQFKMKAGEKPEVDPKLHDTTPVVFGGPLEFVNRLSEIIPSNGFSDPPKLDVGPSGIGVGYSLAIPTVAVGIFSLQNMAIGAMLRLPFDGDPVSIRFNFSERQKPFLLTVSLFGGGGFFALALDNSGVREVEAAFEFGAMAAINLGVASGSVYVKAGIYFHWKTDTVELEGYFEMGGEMSVLGIISVSLKFHLSLGYYKSGGKSEVKGQATLTVEIEILFFSASVSVKCERRLGGSDADPLFVEFYPTQTVWDDYAQAFA